MRNHSIVRLAAASAVVFVLCGADRASALLSSQEYKCAGSVAKSFSKYESTLLKEFFKCRNNDIAGKVDSPSACLPLRASSPSKIDAAKIKLIASAAKSCQSVCSTSSDKPCVSDLSCPPNNGKSESCTGKGGTAPFRVGRLGFPGPYCEGLLGHTILEPDDVGQCVSELAERLAQNLIDNLYGDAGDTSALSADAIKCLSSISKAVTKSSLKIHGAVAKCRNIQQGNPSCVGGTEEGAKCHASSECGGGGACGINPGDCLTRDGATIATVNKELLSISATVAKSCTNDAIAGIPALCRASGAAPTNVDEASACVSALVKEVAASVEGPSRRVYSPYSMVNATNPDAGFGYCGDGVVNETRNESNGVGEECDGDDTPCGAGHCLPPGDLFECTCDNVPRERSIVDGNRVDSDTGWTGASHDAVHNENFGFVSRLSNCTCGKFEQATCTEPTGDSVCDEYASTAPRCSNAMGSSLTCDERGDNDGSLEDGDCFACDSYSANAGTFCSDGEGHVVESACQAQCFDDTTGLAVGTCTRQADCGPGKTCRGRCDGTAKCRTITEGSPLPLVSAATTVCVQQQYVTDVTGTKDMVSGEAMLHYATRTVIYLGETQTTPCPTCGGVCIGGTNDRHPCYGRCNDAGNERCLVDSDCAETGDVSCEQAADDCAGGYCSLDLRCSSGDNAGKICRPMANTPLGVVSADCPPALAKNLSGFGVGQNYGDVTTEKVEFPTGAPCTDPAWRNYTCPCPDGGGLETAPNKCEAACDAGVNLGKGCALTDSSTGIFTTCAGGADDGIVCDEDSDCEGGTCSNTPKQCVAGAVARIGKACASNAECNTSTGSGDGVCESACPGGRCVPLCNPEGTCSGGTRAGDPCGTDVHCGGGTCVVTNTEDGVCAAGPLKYRCTGAGFTTLPCDEGADGTARGCEAGPDGIAGNSDDIPGAGICESRPLDCYYNNGAMEGGDTANGNGDPNNFKYVSAFCTAPAATPLINMVSGFGGPSKITRYGSAFVNVPSIP